MSGVSMRKPVLVVVAGSPATGKSTLARALADALGWPAFYKDVFKEALFDAQGAGGAPSDRSVSQALGKQSIGLLYLVAGELIDRGISCIVESYFHPGLAGPELARFTGRARLVQVHCSVDEETQRERYRNRFVRGERHAVHMDDVVMKNAELRSDPAHRGPIPLDDAMLIQVTSDDGFVPDADEIVRRIREDDVPG